VFLGIVLAVLPLAARARATDDYLIRGEPSPDPRYGWAQRDLWEGWRKDVAFRILVIPPFASAIVIGLRRDDGSYRGFIVEAAGSGKSDLRKKDFKERPVRTDLAETCISIGNRVLGDPRNYRAYRTMYFDTTELCFFVREPRGGSLAAHTMGWERPTQAGLLLDVSDVLGSYVDHEITELQLQGHLARLQKKLRPAAGHTTKPSNHALQRTAGRSDV
jgi:hypothetical protein